MVPTVEAGRPLFYQKQKNTMEFHELGVNSVKFREVHIFWYNGALAPPWLESLIFLRESWWFGGPGQPKMRKSRKKICFILNTYIL